jgi:hypothetical protein
MSTHELLLPLDVLSCAEKHDNEYRWRGRDLNRVADVAEKIGLASDGWRIIFRSLDGEREIYLNYSQTDHRLDHETWSQYVNRSWRETRLKLQELFENKKLINDGKRIIKMMQKTENYTILPHNVIWFVLYFESETMHDPPGMETIGIG